MNSWNWYHLLWLNAELRIYIQAQNNLWKVYVNVVMTCDKNIMFSEKIKKYNDSAQKRNKCGIGSKKSDLKTPPLFKSSE